MTTRRALLAGAPALALAACESRAQPAAYVGALKDLAPFPIGTCVMSGQIGDPGWRTVADQHFSQLTPEWELKMEAVLRPDGSYDFTAADAIAAYARSSGKRLYGTTLVWYAQESPAFDRIDGTGARFASAYRNYIAEVSGRYRGQAVAWDVVNEPVAEDGNGLRDCIWRRNLGEGYIDRAFEHAAEADPAALRVLNEYNLESLPAKQRTFLRLVEGLLKRGAPVTALGTQSHLDVSLPRGAYAAHMRELAAFGLPIHVSELDIARGGGRIDLRGDIGAAQARLAEEVAQALLDLPPAQRFALTLWGVRDSDSWLRRRPGGEAETPLAFDAAGRPKPIYEALARAFAAA